MKYLLLAFIFIGCSSKVPTCISMDGTAYAMTDDTNPIAKSNDVIVKCIDEKQIVGVRK